MFGDQLEVLYIDGIVRSVVYGARGTSIGSVLVWFAALWLDGDSRGRRCREC